MQNSEMMTLGAVQEKNSSSEDAIWNMLQHLVVLSQLLTRAMGAS